MAKPTKAQINYLASTEEGSSKSLRFHSVEVEDHEVQSELTKYPSQSGFLVSNNAIKRNRKVSITGLVTNHQLAGASNVLDYGGSNAIRTVFEILRGLVQNSTPCEVLTNYGNYTPVIFNKFKTKMDNSTTDCARFTISGEEIQLARWNDGTAPEEVNFTEVSAQEREALVTELGYANIKVANNSKVLVGKIDLSRSFKVKDLMPNGETIESVYEVVNFSEAAGTVSHLIHTTDLTEVVSNIPDTFNWFELLAGETPDLPGYNGKRGAPTSNFCLADGLNSLQNGALSQDTLTTVFGELTKSAYGAAYAMVSSKTNDLTGQLLSGLGNSCLVLGNTFNGSELSFESGLPSVDGITTAARTMGNNIAAGRTGTPTLTKLIKITQ